MAGKITKESCIALLKNKALSLTEQGEIRYPKRSDFTEDEVVAIKAHLGPWPRALEAADLKPPREDNQAQRTRAKREQAKLNRISKKERNTQ